MRKGFTKEQDIRHSLRLSSVLKVLKREKVINVIDVGCGDGQFLELAAKSKKFKSIQGIEPVDKNILTARKYVEKFKNVSIAQGNINDLGNEYENFDAVVLIEVIEHLNPKKDLKIAQDKIFKLLKPRIVVITTPLTEKGVTGCYRNQKEMNKLGHFFEWTLEEAVDWGKKISKEYNYSFKISELKVNVRQKGSILLEFKRK